jgi:hypothetical protein
MREEKERGVGLVALAAAIVLLAMGGMPSAEESRESERPVSLQAVGAVGPGSLLTLQTASGPMQLTVDSQMNPGQHSPACGCGITCT